MNLRYIPGLLVLTLGCSTRIPETVDEHKAPLPSAKAGKTGAEQTEGPSISAGEHQYPPETMERPIPVVQFQPLDMTSAVSTDDKLIISVRDLGKPIEPSLLTALQQQ